MVIKNIGIAIKPAKPAIPEVKSFPPLLAIMDIPAMLVPASPHGL
jgi:hypothetical protein